MHTTIFYIPGAYLLYSRLKGFEDKVSWLIWYLVPQFLLVLNAFDYQFGLSLVAFTLAWSCFICCYEIGYISNDVKTTKTESNPTIRLKRDELDYGYLHFRRIVVLRSIQSVIFASFIIYFAHLIQSSLFLAQFFICIVGTILAFWFHNSVRSKRNIISFLVLAHLKYWCIPLLFYSFFLDWDIFLYLALLFPIIRVFEHASKEKYQVGFAKIVVGNADVFRLRYYAGLFIASVIWAVINGETRALVFSIAVAYFLIFRISSYYIRSQIQHVQ